MKLFLDDIRTVPMGFTHVARTAEEAISLIVTGKVTSISFDHDLGDGLTGYDVAKFIEKGAHNGSVSALAWEIHSANPVGRANIERAMQSAERYWRGAL